MSIVRDILKDETLVFLDLETTGLNFHSDKIIEIGAVKVKNGAIVEKFHRLINPKIPIPFFITHLTGIKPQDVLDKPSIEEVKDELFAFLDKHPIVCHNISFERAFLSVIKSKAPENIFIDTCELSAILYPVLVSYKLEKLLEFFQIKNKEAHRALVDAEDTFRLWETLFASLKKCDLERIGRVNEILSQTSLPLKKIFGDLAGALEKSFSGEIEAKEDMRAPTEIVAETEDSAGAEFRKRKIDKGVIEEIFKTGGLLSQVMPCYEARREQMFICEAAAKAFDENKYLVMEAGTGIGKSLGYLVPAVIFSVWHKEKIVISTNTKNLQDQLADKDIPIAASALKADLKTAVVKGRDNYLCLKKLDDLFRDLDNADDETKFALAYLVSFKYQTSEGQLDEVSPYLLRTNRALRNFVSFLACEDALCLKNKCSRFGECFFQKMIKRASEADILIANHSLIFSQPEWMPEYSYLILDEAHNIEDAATNAFTEKISLKELRLLMNNLAAKKLGFDFAKKKDFKAADLQALEQNVLKAKEAVENFSKELISFFDLDGMRLNENIIVENLSEIEKNGEFKAVEKACLAVINSLEEIIKNFFSLSSSTEIGFKDKLMASGFAEKIEDKIHIMRKLIFPDDKKIKWLEFSMADEDGNKRVLSWTFFCAPLEVSAMLAEQIYSPLKAAVFISAVLKVGGSFSFFLERAGVQLLDNRRVFFETFGSPFDFQKSVILGIPKNFPAYNHNTDERYLNALAGGIRKAVIFIRGKSLALFSSKKRMKEIYTRVKDAVEKEGILTMCQDLDGTRQSLISRLQNDKQDILVFGSKSFQEAVDVSGLSAVFIDKLFFPHRDNPVIFARRNYLINQGKNPFKEYELPQAIMVLKQGFGRLIRNKKDFGLVVIFDSRLLDKEYKEVVLKSLPKVQLVSIEESEFYTVLKQKFEEIKKESQSQRK